MKRLNEVLIQSNEMKEFIIDSLKSEVIEKTTENDKLQRKIKLLQEELNFLKSNIGE